MPTKDMVFIKGVVDTDMRFFVFDGEWLDDARLFYARVWSDVYFGFGKFFREVDAIAFSKGISVDWRKVAVGYIQPEFDTKNDLRYQFHYKPLCNEEFSREKYLYLEELATSCAAADVAVHAAM